MSTATVTDPTSNSAEAIHSVDARRAQVAAQAELLASLRAQAASGGDPKAAAAADALALQYHAADAGLLAKDVYRSAAHDPAPPGLGYLRASEHPDMLRTILKNTQWSDRKIAEFLHPRDYDFRAEIYLPDPAIYGHDAKPVLVFKGSNGMVYAPDANGATTPRESALEDWVENFRQGLGLESDHYNRAMGLARELQNELRGPFEIVGHSKGGGEALAASAVTGMPSITFNAASLNPETAQRFAKAHGIITKVYDSGALNQGYYVQGEMLHDGLDLIRGASEGLPQEQVAHLFRSVGELSQIPGAHANLERYLEAALPHDPQMVEATLGLVDHLAKHADAQALQRIPTHAGEGHLVRLAPMGRDADGRLVERPAQASLQDSLKQSNPLLDSIDTVLTVSVAGKRAGEAIAHAGASVDAGLQAVGAASRTGWEITGKVVNDGSRQTGKIVAERISFGGEVIAQGRLQAARIEATVDRAQASVHAWRNQTSSALLRGVHDVPLIGGLAGRAADALDRDTAAYRKTQQAEAQQAETAGRVDAAAIRSTTRDVAGHARAGLGAGGEQLAHGASAVGHALEQGYRSAGTAMHRVTAAAPALGAAAGAAAGTTYQIGPVVLDAASKPPIMSAAATLVAAAKARTAVHGIGEAVNRHAQEEVVQPSLDARTRELETQARGRLHPHAVAKEPAQAAPAAKVAIDATSIGHPQHKAYPLFQDAQRAMGTHQAATGTPPGPHDDKLAGALASEMYVAGGQRIDAVATTRDASRTFAVQGGISDPAQLRVGVHTAEALQTSLEQSGERAAQAELARAASIVPAEQAQRDGPRLG